MQWSHAAMHRGAELSWGFRSTATQHSSMVLAVPLQKGSVVEALAGRGKVDFLITIDGGSPERCGLPPDTSA